MVHVNEKGERIQGLHLGRGSNESVEEIYRQAFYLEFWWLVWPTVQQGVSA